MEVGTPMISSQSGTFKVIQPSRNGLGRLTLAAHSPSVSLRSVSASSGSPSPRQIGRRRRVTATAASASPGHKEITEPQSARI